MKACFDMTFRHRPFAICYGCNAVVQCDTGHSFIHFFFLTWTKDGAERPVHFRKGETPIVPPLFISSVFSESLTLT